MTTSRLAVIAVLMLPATSHAQQTPVRDGQVFTSTGTGVVRGQVVVDDDARTPLRRAAVALSRVGAEDMRWTASDDQGQFVFTALPAATYSLSASKGGFISISSGAAKPGMPGRQIVLRDGESVVLPPIALPRGAVIAGRITDSSGQPVSNAQVRASRFVTVNGERQLRAGTATWNAATNEHGDYRIFGLPSGEYVVAAWQNGWLFQSEMTQADIDAVRTPANTQGTRTPSLMPRPFAFAPTMFPGTVDEESAAALSLKPGEERLGVDVALQRVPVARISGVVFGVDGKPAAGVPLLRGTRRAQIFTPAAGAGVSTGVDGWFSLTGVAPGDYVLQARGVAALAAQRAEELVSRGMAVSSVLSTAGQWANAEVLVNGADISGITLRMQPGMLVSGTVVLRSAQRVDLTRITVQLTPLAAGPTTRVHGTGVDAQDTFKIESVLPGRYRLSILSLPGGLSVRSALLGDVDLLDAPVEVRPGGNLSDIAIVISDVRTELGGTLTDAAGRPASQLYVLAFSQDRAHWSRNSRRILSVRAGMDGTYMLSGLPAGDYFLCALPEIDTTLQYEAEYLDQLVPASLKIALGDGEKKIQNLRVGGPPSKSP